MRALTRLRPAADQLVVEGARAPQFICRTCILRASRAPFATSSHNRQHVLRPATTVINPATTWKGLEWVATPEKLAEQAALSAPSFPEFLPAHKVTDPQHVEAEVLKALVEVFTLVRKNIPLHELRNGFPQWPEGVSVGIDNTSKDTVVQFPSAEAERLFAQSLTTTSENKVENEGEEFERGIEDDMADAGEGQENPASAHEALKAEGGTQTWKQISLKNPEIRFAVVKRVMRRTGLTLADPIIQNCATAGALFNRITEKPKPQKLVEAIEVDKRLTKLPNVKVIPKRVGLVEKETQVGRWKIIKEELAKRGLSETGSNYSGPLTLPMKIRR
ncbi:hypothetical protein EJ06DRAFT_558131 [Trichodelitschia bisporula]|uniref:Large ribosomal subunit protein mL50 n=1 Tax=Trichodelitschia bisporula TaxID=703511 RepID=A0A6G1HRA4_9PEZI|nr:hypothetical protein EJ06DRAFT_558131 [Trichodelitschia bisporula]